MHLLWSLFVFVLSVGVWLPPQHSVVAQSSPPQFERTDCPVPIPSGIRVECGALAVLEDREQPQGARIRLPVVIVKSRTTPTLPDPIVFTAGGPGFSSFGNIAGFARARYTEQRDLIIMEQRGTRYAEPSLDCPEIDRAILDNLTRAAPLDEEIAHEVTAATTCRARLTHAGSNVAAYHTGSIAADFEDLRRVLGYDQWNLFGTSYSTRLMFTMMRAYPAHIRSVVLDSAAPLPVKQYEQQWGALDRALQYVFTTCRADPRCTGSYPHLEQQFRQVIDRFNREPLAVTITDPLRHQSMNARITGDDIAFLVMGMLYDWQTIPYVPFLIDQLAHGNDAAATPLVQSGIAQFLRYQRGTYYSVQCQDQMPFNDPSVMAREQTAYPSVRDVHIPLYRSDPRICEVWNVPAAPPETHAPITSMIPTLFVGGPYDPVVAPEWSDAAATTLGTSFVYRVPNMGHSAVIKSSCGIALAAEFFDQPHKAPDTCTTSLANMPFMMPDQIAPTSAGYRLNMALTHQRSQLIGWLVWCMLVMFSTLMALGRMMRVWHTWSRLSRAIALVAGIAAVLYLVFMVGIGITVQRIRITEPIMLGFGLPASVSPLLVLPLIASTCSAALVGLVGWLWIKRMGTLRTRLFYTISTVTLVGHTVVLASLHLLLPALTNL